MEKEKKVIIIAFLILFFCQGKQKDKEVETKPGFEKVHLVESRGEKPSFELIASDVIDKEDSILLVSFKVIFYDSLGRKSGELKGDSGWINKKNFNIFARKNVVLKTEKESLFTQEVIWIDSLKIAKSDRDVVLYHEGNVTHGKGFTTTRNLKEILIIGRVKGGEK